MKDDFETRMRQFREAEADIGFDSDPVAEDSALAKWTQMVTQPGLDLMRAFWAPNWRK